MTYLGQKRIAQMESSLVTSTARYTIETPVSKKTLALLIVCGGMSPQCLHPRGVNDGEPWHDDDSAARE